MTSEELPFIDLTTIRVATDDFADSNKLGQGGFGTVYMVYTIFVVLKEKKREKKIYLFIVFK